MQLVLSLESPIFTIFAQYLLQDIQFLQWVNVFSISEKIPVDTLVVVVYQDIVNFLIQNPNSTSKLTTYTIVKVQTCLQF